MLHRRFAEIVVVCLTKLLSYHLFCTRNFAKVVSTIKLANLRDQVFVECFLSAKHPVLPWLIITAASWLFVN